MGKRIETAIAKSGLTHKKVASKLGVAENTLSNYVTNKRVPRADLLADISRLCKASPEWLLMGEGPVDREKLPEAGTNLPKQSVDVPIYETALGAGPGGQPSDRIVGYGSFLRRWLRQQAGISPEKAFLAEVRGYSMMPIFNDHDLVIGEFCEEIDHNGIYAVAWNEELLIKHVEKGSRSLRLVSENSAFGVETIEGEQMSELRVIGRVTRKVTRPY